MFRKPVSLGAGALAAMVLCGWLPVTAYGCGYDPDPAVGLTIAHPSSVAVAMAISDAVDAGRLQPRPELPAQLALMWANGATRKFSVALGPILDAGTLPPMTLLLVEPRLWSRIAPGPGGTRFEFHVNGPASGDVVLVTGESVLRELLDGRVSWERAVATGIAVLDGPADQRGEIARTLTQRFPGSQPELASR